MSVPVGVDVAAHKPVLTACPVLSQELGTVYLPAEGFLLLTSARSFLRQASAGHP